MVITHVYADGGVIGPGSRSSIGVTWAWRHVQDGGPMCGTVLHQSAGWMEPGPDVGLDTLTNNIAEMVALLRCVEALPKDWSGIVHSDSMVALGRFFLDYRNEGVPPWLVTRNRAGRAWLGDVTWVLLEGHPSLEDLQRGVGSKRSLPVSIHNVWCDEACTAIAKAVMKERSSHA